MSLENSEARNSSLGELKFNLSFCKEIWALQNWCFWTAVLEKTLESPLDFKEIKPVNPKGNQSWIFIGRTDAETETPKLCEELTHWKIPWCWERLKTEGERDHREWDGWMASLTWWTWVWINSRSWWWTGKPGVLPSMGSQRVRHNWATELSCIHIHYNTIHRALMWYGCITHGIICTPKLGFSSLWYFPRV